MERGLALHGHEAFREECLRPVTYGLAIERLVGAPPAYDLHGAARVAAGVYSRVIRYREHVAPIADALVAHLAHGLPA